MHDQPTLSCDLTALDPEERKRHRQVAETVLTSVQEIREQPRGYSFRLPSETEMIQQAATFISRERLCCPFFTFALEANQNHGPVWLTLTGGEAVKHYLAENVVARIDASREKEEETS